MDFNNQYLLRILVTPLLFCTLPIFTLGQNLPKTTPQLIDKVTPKLIEWRRHLHQNPELGNREFKTAAYIEKHLKSLGLEVKTGVAKTGVVAILKGGKPGSVVALRADMDALPVTERNDLPFKSTAMGEYNGQQVGLMHACGHDSHVAILMATAEVLTNLKKDLPGTVVFIFQPAEEGVPRGEEGGAELMVKEGVLENPKVEAIFGLHIDSQIEAGIIAYRPGSIMAGINDMKITVNGRQAHGASPWASIDPIVVSAQIINNLQTIVSRNLNLTENAGIVTIGAIHGGVRTNIIPEKVEMLGTVRTMTKDDEAMFIERIKTIVTKTAEAAGATAEVLIPFSSHYPVTFNDLALTEKMLPSFKKAAGNDKVILKVPRTIAEDFSFYGEKIPALFFFLGGMPIGKDPITAPSHHTPDFFIDESGFSLGVKTFCQLVFDYNTQN